ncbi:hypothetical protein CPB84DRAFT_1528446 [Gymnopilus junonius]|uniref:ubiquitinyl hydrolase 1 n=1 Tax=Gymnopilus junonius TaxID=109634 RepID=A0A9P5NGW3_GYMJU|nr:hypothetical protein CPB84DRAFT_1528446 [Gymnopilus junonius]
MEIATLETTWISSAVLLPLSSPTQASHCSLAYSFTEHHPGVFTSLTRNLGIDGLELVELYDIEPWAVDHLRPHGLIFCFMWRKDSHRPADFQDPSAERVWFANQLSDDACATHAILNVVLNCPGVDVGEELRRFREDTKEMSPVMRGLAVTNSPTIRAAHNALARPSDVRASLNSITITTFDAEKRKEKEKAKKAQHPNEGKPPPAKRARTTSKSPVKSKSKAKAKGKQASTSTSATATAATGASTSMRPQRNRKVKVWVEDTDSDEEEDEDEDEDKPKEEDPEEETYHFIGYVPAYGKVWELDGLKSGPLEVGELPLPAPQPPSISSVHPSSSASPSAIPSSSAPLNPTQTPDADPTASWMDIVRPALRMKMEKYGGSGNDGSNIRFSLLAIVDDGYEKASDELEYQRREKVQLERRLDELAGEGEGQGQGERSREGWVGKVDPSLLGINLDLTHLHQFTSKPTLQKNPVYAPDFALRRQTRDIEISRMEDEGELIKAWESCMRDAIRARVGLEDELTKGVRANVSVPFFTCKMVYYILFCFYSPSSFLLPPSYLHVTYYSQTDHIKRTWDYEPFIREYLQRLHREGLLFPLLDRDADGRKKRGPKKGTAAGAGAGKS